MAEAQTDRFLGLTKFQYMLLILLLVVLMSCIDAYLFTRHIRLAEQGAQSHKVLCVLREDYARHKDESDKFLSLSPEQRRVKYGKAFGDIPNSVLIQSNKNLSSNLQAMKSLEC